MKKKKEDLEKEQILPPGKKLYHPMKNMTLRNIEFDTLNSIKEDEDNDNDEDYTSNLLNNNKAINEEEDE